MEKMLERLKCLNGCMRDEENMKVFIAGDHRTGTGPANVTKEYINCFPKEVKVTYQKMVSKLSRVPELIVKIASCDIVLFSGYSRQNLLGIKLASLFGKRTAYLMHGCVEYENEINGVPDSSMAQCERDTIAGVDRVYAVSVRFANWLKDYYPDYANKMDYAINGAKMPADLHNLTDKSNSISSGEYNVFSIGGGMP